MLFRSGGGSAAPNSPPAVSGALANGTAGQAGTGGGGGGHYNAQTGYGSGNGGGGIVILKWT